MILTVVLLAISPASSAEIYIVPGDYGTIRAALAAAVDGDTIIVRNGVYTGQGNKNLDFAGKAITLRSQNGAEHCIIDCEQFGRGFVFYSGETNDSVLDGFTICNGSVDGEYPANSGGGIYLANNSSPTIRNCIIRDNTADGFISGGGGIFSMDSSPRIENCVIRNNTVLDRYGAGGGIEVLSGFPVITRCRIADNRSERDGGGFSSSSGGGIISESVITGNSSSSGGGIRAGSDISIVDCTISDNSAERGGGISGSYGCIIGCDITNNFAYIEGGGINNAQFLIRDCTISRNVAKIGGGASLESTPVMINCIIAENWAYEEGGGIAYRYGDSFVITFCTIVDNRAENYGGGIAFEIDDANCSLEDCILRSNSAADGPEISLRKHNGRTPPPLTVNHSNVEGGQANVYVETDCVLKWDASNIDANPLFVNGPSGEYYLSQTASGQYHDSPCIDSGSDLAINLGVDLFSTRTDQAGDTGIADMGFHYRALEGAHLARINMLLPANESIISMIYPRRSFVWSAIGGNNNAFVVDMSFSIGGTIYTSPVIRGQTSWAMPLEWWDRIPSRSFVYWRVRGADLDVTPLSIIYSDELWWFYKP